VASVAVDVPLPHLDRAFDYAVPAELVEAAQPGVRVRVRLAGRLLNGMILARTDGSSFTGKLQPLSKVLGTESVLSPEIAGLCRAVADRWAGTFSDVLRLAVPPRHARVEKEAATPARPLPAAPDPAGWGRYVHGAAFLEHLAKNGSGSSEPGPRATWAALPGSDWPAELVAAAQATLSAGRGVVIVVPDARDSVRVAAALKAAIGAERFVELSAELGPAERYRRFLRLARGQVQVVVGTRAAAYAPVADLGLVGVWDDGSDLHDELHAPYANVRDVLVLRAHLAGAGALIGGYAPSVEAVTLLETGWAQPVTPSRDVLRAAAPRVEVAGSEAQLARDPQARAARLPDLAFAAVRGALAAGLPALVSVPRRGYRPALACARCRTPLRCPACRGPLAQEASTEVLTCRWCAAVQRDLECPECGAHERRAMVIGDARTADELGRAFPGVPVIRSSGAGIVDAVAGEPALVVATPGAEPVAAGGYGAVLLLDAWALLGRADLRAGEEALRRWMDAAALARPAAEGGQVVLVGASSGLTPVQALVRWDPLGYARFEAASRAELGFPPASRMAALDATSEQIDAFLAAAQLPADAELLGPVPLNGEGERLLVRVPRGEGTALASALQTVSRLRSVKSEPVVRVRLDPSAIG
ncbi:MAG: Primosomal protein, partial [Mycobacterium sp.]|nr:Primosomal protein [Mycobacterium sp.]